MLIENKLYFRTVICENDVENPGILTRRLDQNWPKPTNFVGSMPKSLDRQGRFVISISLAVRALLNGKIHHQKNIVKKI
jgi:hypothetical protein